jgi:hypothetical protein
VPKRPHVPNQLAKLIVDLAAEKKTEAPSEPFTTAQKFNRSGSLKGGVARAKALTAEQRREIARKVTAKRWRAGIST